MVGADMSRTTRRSGKGYWEMCRSAHRAGVERWRRRTAQKRYRAEVRDQIKSGCYEDLEDPRHLTGWFDR